MSLIITKGLGSSSAGISLHVISATAPMPGAPTTGLVVLTFNSSLALTGTSALVSSWSITNPSNITLPITAVVCNTAAHTVTLTTNEQVTGTTYTVHIPTVGIIDSVFGGSLIAPYTITFVGNGANPTILYSRGIDENTIEIAFSKAVVIGEAIVSANYTVDGGITVISAAQQLESNTIFRITTRERMLPATTYSITISNIHDISGNPI